MSSRSLEISNIMPSSKTITLLSSNKANSSETSNEASIIHTIKSPRDKCMGDNRGFPSNSRDKIEGITNSQCARHRCLVHHYHRRSDNTGPWHKLKSNFLTVFNLPVSNCQLHCNSKDKDSRNNCCLKQHGTKLSTGGDIRHRHCKRHARHTRYKIRHRTETRISVAKLHELSKNVNYLAEITQQQIDLNNALLNCLNNPLNTDGIACDQPNVSDKSNKNIPSPKSSFRNTAQSSSSRATALQRVWRNFRQIMKRKPKQLNFELPLLPSVEDLKANREVEWVLPELPEITTQRSIFSSSAELELDLPLVAQLTSDTNQSRLRSKASRVAGEVKSLVKIYERNNSFQEPHSASSFAKWYLNAKRKIQSTNIV